MMRATFLVLFAIGTLSAIDVTPAAARDYPFCIKGPDYDSSVGDCRFDSYQQCMASASGLFASCDVNQFFRGPQPPVDRPPASRRTY